MSTTPTAIASTSDDNLFHRAKAFFGVALFLIIHRSPRLLQLHRNEKSWTLFRIALACFGAALVVLPLGLWNGWITAIFGLLLFVVAILLPPAELESGTDRKARELGAQTVVSGESTRPRTPRPRKCACSSLRRKSGPWTHSSSSLLRYPPRIFPVCALKGETRAGFCKFAGPIRKQISFTPASSPSDLHAWPNNPSAPLYRQNWRQPRNAVRSARDDPGNSSQQSPWDLELCVKIGVWHVVGKVKTLNPRWKRKNL